MGGLKKISTFMGSKVSPSWLHWFLTCRLIDDNSIAPSCSALEAAASQKSPGKKQHRTMSKLLSQHLGVASKRKRKSTLRLLWIQGCKCLPGIWRHWSWDNLNWAVNHNRARIARRRKPLQSQISVLSRLVHKKSRRHPAASGSMFLSKRVHRIQIPLGGLNP